MHQLETVFRIDFEVVFRWKDSMSPRHSKTCYQSHSSTLSSQTSQRRQHVFNYIFQILLPVRVKTWAWYNILLPGD